MAADVGTTLASWSTTAASNSPSGATVIGTNLDDNLRQIQAVVRTLAASDTIASAGTTDLSTKDAQYLTVSGTTTITALGTLSAGMAKWLVFSGALTFTHNAASLILPGAANITTAAGDTACLLSLGSGNWRCLTYVRANGTPVVSGVALSAVTAATANATLANAAFAQTWQWRLTAAGSAFSLAESAASTGGASNQYLLDLSTLTTSTMSLLKLTALGQALATINALGSLTYTGVGGAFTPSGAASAVSFTGGAGTSTAAGGAITLAGGNNPSSGDGGGLTLASGDSTAGAAGVITVTGGAAGGAGATGGAVQITGGSGGPAGTAASVAIKGGARTGGTGADVTLDGGAGTNKGDVKINSALLMRGRSAHLHALVAAGSPTISAGGGTAPSISGTDNAFKITVGSGGTATSVTVTFAAAWEATPIVIAQHQGAVLALRCSAGTTTVAISASTAFTAGGIIDVLCMGIQ